MVGIGVLGVFAMLGVVDEALKGYLMKPSKWEDKMMQTIPEGEKDLRHIHTGGLICAAQNGP